ncbi:MAG: hypothetical protein J5784_02150 [Muribaculaceae bacterium]|nr:hypothetical protein [Muribaculaceae bacterium]
MGAIIGILSRMFSSAGIIIVILLGVIICVLGDVLEFAFFAYGAIIWGMIILAFLPVVAILFEHLIYPFRWLNSILLGTEKPKFDFLRIGARMRLDSLRNFKNKSKKERLAE